MLLSMYMLGARADEQNVRIANPVHCHARPAYDSITLCKLLMMPSDDVYVCLVCVCAICAEKGWARGEGLLYGTLFY